MQIGTLERVSHHLWKRSSRVVTVPLAGPTQPVRARGGEARHWMPSIVHLWHPRSGRTMFRSRNSRCDKSINHSGGNLTEVCMYIPKWVGSGSSNPGSGMQPWKDPVRHILSIASINSLQVTQSYIMYSLVSFPLSLPCAGLAG